MWDLIVSVPDHCLSFYFTASALGKNIFCHFTNTEEAKRAREKDHNNILCLSPKSGVNR